jgi:hypothetical protein
MDAKDAIRSCTNLSSTVLKTYISDLDDADLMRRPGPGCNHLAWQLGHLISSEAQLLESIAPGKSAKLPDGFAQAHSKETSENDDPAAFRSKAEYERLFDDVRAASLTALDGLPPAALDEPGPEHFRKICPKVGDMFTLIATHPMMHAGQFVAVRPQLGKPVLI